jgi:hypothetical protein
MNNYTDTPKAAELSPEASRAVGSAQARKGSVPLLKKPRVFARDLETTNTGAEDYILSSIIKGPFSGKNWEEAKNDITRFLALPRSPEAAGRARFYLGQCWYFLNKPRDGLFEFLAIREKYPLESMEWIRSSLEMMTN